MRILFASLEMVPFVKVGGLADVADALTKELARQGHDVVVLMPRPAQLPFARVPGMELREVAQVAVTMQGRIERGVLEKVLSEGEKREILFLRSDRFLPRPNPYIDPATGKDWPDNAQRFVFFCKAVVETMRLFAIPPEVVHLNDYQTGLVPILARQGRWRETLGGIGIVYAIHNMGYQGIFPPAALGDLGEGLIERFHVPAGPLEFFGGVNFMKAGVVYADVVTTVSPRYALEIQSGREFGHGLEGVLRARSNDLIGILNGIDTEIWNPATDPLLPANYSSSNLGPKAEDKARLLQAMELPAEPDAPVIGMISRLVHQKGFDLLSAAAPEIFGMGVRLVVLGSGEARYEELMRALRRHYPAQFGANLTFNDPLAHLIEAGSDFFLMPSRYEPCGLNQMYSLRYGTIPIVRATGGLADTVQEYDPATGRGNGFVFEEYSAEAMLAALRRGLEAYARRRAWKKLMATVMQIDHSWTRAAGRYIAVYERAIAARG